MDRYNYVNTIMTNGHLDNVSSEDGYYLFSEGMEERYGGAVSHPTTERSNKPSNTELNINSYLQPTGGFPPIYVIARENEKEKEKEKKPKSRELSTRSSAVSITDILKKKNI
jgi:hypothetical protein